MTEFASPLGSVPPATVAGGRLDRLRGFGEAVVRRPVAVLLVMLVAAFICYGPALNGDFIWDDHELVVNNPAIRSPVMAVEIFRHYLSFNSPATFYRPVQNLSYLCDYYIWGIDPFGYRLTNLLLHALNGWLLFLVLRIILPKFLSQATDGKRDFIAFTVALFWLVHPAHNAAVAYIAGRADSLAVGFALLSWLGYERGVASSRRAAQIVFYLLAFVSALLAFCSKEIGAIWLAIFAVYLLMGKRDVAWGRRAMAFAGGLLAFGLYIGLRHLPVAPAGMGVPPPPVMPSRIILMARALGDYTTLLFFPARLCMERQVFPAYGQTPTAGEQAYYQFLFVLGLAVIPVVGVALWRRGPGQGLRVFGAAWFVLAYLPISNLLPLNASVAEHWMYTPSIGFFLFLTGCWPLLPKRAAPWAAALAGVALPLFILRTSLRTGDWLNEFTLFQQTIDAGTHSTRARLSLANAYSRVGKPEVAEGIFRSLVADFPKWSVARANLASTLLREGKTAEGVAMLRPLIDASSDPTSMVTAWKSLTLVENDKLDAGAMLKKLDGSLARLPESWGLLELKSQLLHGQGRTGEALDLLTEFTRKQWWNYQALLLLGQLSAENGESQRAIAAYEQAGRLDVHEVTSLQLRALLYMDMGRPALARVVQEKAISRQPDRALNYTILANILAKLDKPGEERSARARAALLQGAL